jgi:hypothetical protein
MESSAMDSNLKIKIGYRTMDDPVKRGSSIAYEQGRSVPY